MEGLAVRKRTSCPSFMILLLLASWLPVLLMLLTEKLQEVHGFSHPREFQSSKYYFKRTNTARTQRKRNNLPETQFNNSIRLRAKFKADDHYFDSPRNRRSVLSSGLGIATSATASLSFWKEKAAAKETTASSVPIQAAWSAVDGLNSMDSSQQFVSFDVSAYRAMKDDPTRTPFFEKAIAQRLSRAQSPQVVLDLGTGPFALFAIAAAEAGAGKVYAIEANPAAAASARTLVAKKGLSDVIVILEGFSTRIDLPEKVDLCIAEIVGSVASEESAYATIRDAAARLVKEPFQESSWIPNRIQTYAAPASYSLHNLFGPPEFDWNKLKDPVRFNCRDQGLQLLSDPVLVEDLSFVDLLSAGNGPEKIIQKDFTFYVDSDRMDENTLELFEEFRRGKSSVRDSEILAYATGHSFSGIALWPRLILDDSAVVDSRHFGDGGHQRSHWQTVLPIMCSRPVGELKGGERIRIHTDFRLSDKVTVPPHYSITGQIEV